MLSPPRRSRQPGLESCLLLALALTLAAALLPAQRAQTTTNTAPKPHTQNELVTGGSSTRALQQAGSLPQGGEPVPRGRFEYVCNLKDNNHKHICGGVLIHERAVLTAAHCVHESFEGAATLNLLVSVGAHSLRDDVTVRGVQDTKVTDIKIHPSFNASNLEQGGDIAILVLDYKAYAQPVTLPLRNFVPELALVALGWGQDSDLLEPIIIFPESNQACEDAYSYSDLGEGILCGYNDTQGLCVGHSGSPLVIPHSPRRGILAGKPKFDTLVGLTSFGMEKCASDGAFLGGFALVGHYRKWIDREIKLIEGQIEPEPPKPEDRALYFACINNEIGRAQALIASGSDVNSRTDNGSSPLHAAVCNGHLEIAKSLIDSGAYINAAENDGLTPLMCATSHPPSVSKLLIDAGADVETEDKSGNTPLTYAILNGNNEAFEQLLAAGADPNRRSVASNGLTPLMIAARSNNTEIVQNLLAAGADANAEKSNAGGTGVTPCLQAIISGSVEVLELLLEAGADPNRKVNGYPPLSVAVKNNSSGIVETLLTAGVNVNLENKDGLTPFLEAIENGRIQMVQVLMQAGGDVNYRMDRTGWSPVLIATDQSFPDIVKILISAGADVSIADNDGRIALHSAASQGNPDMVKILLEAGADPSFLDAEGNSPLLNAVESNSTQTAKILVSTGVDVNAEANDGGNPIIMAALKGNIEITKLLLEADADPDHVNDMGFSALHFSAGSNFTIIAKALITTGADVNIEADDGTTPILFAATTGNMDTFRFLLLAGADPEHVSQSGDSCIYLAALENRLNMVQRLVDLGVNLDPESNQRWSPLQVASYFGRVGIVDSLLDGGASINAVTTKDSIRDDNRTYPQGSTSLHIATVRSNRAIVKRLLSYGADPLIKDTNGNLPINLIPHGAKGIRKLFDSN